MKKFSHFLRLSILVGLSATSVGASAQLYEIANQIPNLISPALSGSLNYKGYVEAGFAGGIGNYRANVASISTSQGFRYSNWFFMGAGIGVDMMFAGAAPNTSFTDLGYNYLDPYYSHSKTSTAWFLPVFTDFRFKIGGNGGKSISAFVDLKLGATFMLNNSYFNLGNGAITSRESFYLKPALGVSIPVSQDHPQQAINIGLTYQLVTANWWNVGDHNVSLNAIGGSVSFEW